MHIELVIPGSRIRAIELNRQNATSGRLRTEIATGQNPGTGARLNHARTAGKINRAHYPGAKQSRSGLDLHRTLCLRSVHLQSPVGQDRSAGIRIGSGQTQRAYAVFFQAGYWRSFADVPHNGELGSMDGTELD